MVNQEEFAICRRRGHKAHVTDQGWAQCDACGMWLREKRTLEEREDEPPADELATSVAIKRLLDESKARRETTRRTDSN
jgi:hypothetical protein